MLSMAFFVEERDWSHRWILSDPWRDVGLNVFKVPPFTGDTDDCVQITAPT